MLLTEQFLCCVNNKSLGLHTTVHVDHWHVLTWKVTVATGIHLAWSLPIPFLAMAFSFNS